MGSALLSFRFYLVAAALIALPGARATTLVGPWVPMFKGIDYSVSTNLPSPGSLPHLMVLHTIRVDLTDPDIRLMTTPRATGYQPDSNETGGLTVSDFQKANHVQVAINANRFTPEEYYLPAGTAMDIFGLAISQGVIVSEEEDRDNAATIAFDATNKPSIIYTNWPAHSTVGMFNAISGTYPILVAGQDIARPFLSDSDVIHRANPRTLFGLSADRRYLYLVAMDGRQPGYSNGGYDYEAAEWLLLLGAADGINLDGGGSTTLVVESSTGVPVRLNESSAVADSGRERTVASHFGVFAKPLPGFINDVNVVPDDTSAKISWTTTDPASSQVQYDTTEALTQQTASDPALVQQHSVQLTGLIPQTSYFYKILSATSTQQFSSPMLHFVTTNYVSTNQLFDLSHSWVFTAKDVSATNWTALSYDDSGWSGPGPGLLWVDVRQTGPNPEVTPKLTQMPSDPSTGYPYVTYYFRSHFVVTNAVPNSSLQISGFVDDGAIFYLNGTEVYRLRMPDGSVARQTLADGYPCDGDATCLDELSFPANLLVAGDNVLAVEVHNFNLKSADITFGLSAALIEPLARSTSLEVSYSGSAITLQWQGTGFILESASALSGPWTAVDGTSASPFVTTATDSSRYYRLRR